MSEVPQDPVTPEINPVIAKLTDFSDRVSPMIVKELRQGMRTRTFTGTFLILQSILGFGMLIALLSDGGDIGKLISTMVFVLFGIVAIILQPLRGIMAVASEFKDDTLELMSLTRLSSLRIVFGKWASIVGQTALMLSATIPYLVMRYFFGGMQLFAELSLLFAIFFLSACLTGLTVGLSCSRAILVRALVPLTLIPAGFGLVVWVAEDGDDLVNIFSWQNKETSISLLTMAVLFAYIGYYFLDMGVSRIAALAENHAMRKRLVSLVLLLIVLVILWFNPPVSVFSVFVVLAFSVAIGIDVCSERAVCVPSVVTPFVKRGRSGKLAGRFLYPGWHSGFYFMTMLLALALVMGHLTYSSDFNLGPDSEIGLVDNVILVILGVFYTILAPLLLRLFIKKIKDPFTGYIGVLVVCAIFTSVIVIFSEMARLGSSKETILLVTSWIPGVWMLMLDSPSMIVIGIVTQGIFLTIVWILLFICANEEFRRTAAFERTVENQQDRDVE